MIFFAGVSALITVALDGVHNAHELQMVEFGQSFGYKKPFYIGMNNIDSAMQKDLVSHLTDSPFIQSF